MGKEIDKAWKTDNYRKLAKAYYEDTVRDYAISDALLVQGVTYLNENDYLVHAVEELLDRYAVDICSAILDLITDKKVTLLGDNDDEIICTTIDELLDVYGLTEEGVTTDEEKSQED